MENPLTSLCVTFEKGIIRFYPNQRSASLLKQKILLVILWKAVYRDDSLHSEHSAAKALVILTLRLQFKFNKDRIQAHLEMSNLKG